MPSFPPTMNTKKEVSSYYITTSTTSSSSNSGVIGVRSYIKSLLKEQVSMLMHEWNVNEEDFIAPYYMRENCPMILVSYYEYI